jgi:hypothetical protein
VVADFFTLGVRKLGVDYTDRREDDAEVYPVVEISWDVSSFDVVRAAHRAVLLRRAGLLALPVVAGKAVLPEAVNRAREMQVWQITDGQVATPEP